MWHMGSRRQRAIVTHAWMPAAVLDPHLTRGAGRRAADSAYHGAAPRVGWKLREIEKSSDSFTLSYDTPDGARTVGALNRTLM